MEAVVNENKEMKQQLADVLSQLKASSARALPEGQDFLGSLCSEAPTAAGPGTEDINLTRTKKLKEITWRGQR